MGYVMRKFGLDLELGPISKIHGKEFRADASYGSISIVTLYHPAAALYNGGMRDQHKKDFEVLKQYV
jgi:DNA polymerase